MREYYYINMEKETFSNERKKNNERILLENILIY